MQDKHCDSLFFFFFLNQELKIFYLYFSPTHFWTSPLEFSCLVLSLSTMTEILIDQGSLVFKFVVSNGIMINSHPKESNSFRRNERLIMGGDMRWR